MTDDNDNKNLQRKKYPGLQAIFFEGKKPIEVAIELGLREGQINKFFRVLEVKPQYRLYEIYPQIEPCLASFLKLHKTLKKRGLNPDNVEWFVDTIETGAIKIPEIQKRYTKVKEELEAIDYKRAIANHELERYE